MSGFQMTRRGFLAAVGAGVAAVTLAACGSPQTPTPTSAPTNQTSASASATSAPAAQSAATGGNSIAGKVIWLVRTDVVENKGEKQIWLPMFKAKYPQLNVDMVITSDASGAYNAKILTLAAAKQGMDLWGFGQNYMDFWARSMPQNLNSYISSDKWDVDNYFLPGLADIYKIHGNHYGLPQDTCYGSPLVYNKDMFDKAGLKPPPASWDDASWTMDQMLEYSQKFAENAGTPDATYGVDIGLQKQTDLSFLWGGSSWMPEHYTNFIAPKSAFNNEANIAGHQYIHDLMYKYKVQPDPSAEQGLNQLGDSFHTGKVAMTMNGGWLYWTERDITAFKVGYAALPTAKANKAVNYDDQWIMASWSTNKDAVWAIMRLLCSVEGTSQYSALSGTPPTPRQATKPWLDALAKYTGQSTDDLTAVTSGALVAKRTQESPDHLFLDWPKISTAYTNKIAALWNDPNATADKVIPDVATALDQVIADIYSQFNGKLPSD